MKSKNVGLRVSGTTFGIIALIHLSRLLTGTSVVIAGFSIPSWVNVIGFFGTVFLFIWFWWLSNQP